MLLFKFLQNKKEIEETMIFGKINVYIKSINCFLTGFNFWSLQILLFHRELRYDKNLLELVVRTISKMADNISLISQKEWNYPICLRQTRWCGFWKILTAFLRLQIVFTTAAGFLLFFFLIKLSHFCFYWFSD